MGGAVGRHTRRETSPVAGLVLPMLLEDGFARVINLNTALADGTLRVMRGLFSKPSAAQMP